METTVYQTSMAAQLRDVQWQFAVTKLFPPSIFSFFHLLTIFSSEVLT